MARLLLISVLLLQLAGCASWLDSDYQDPQVHLLKVEPLKMRLLQQEFVLHVQVDNPNDSRLFIRYLGYKVLINDLPLTEGEASLWRSVGPHARRIFKIPVRTNLWQQVKPLAKLLKGSEGPLRYRLEGEMSSGLFFARDLHLSRSGEIIPGDLIPE
ncbi:LEA type 2 family protein [Pseudomonas sp. BIGb0427]|uniref:LEA type 2 family protein n=1 Tax=unclassified Pseudomonas TaxID=196821 RepID=UPI0008913744|nr:MULTISPECIES: LEA type 2 family protein [unclassified Pseudomonas]QPG63330.1 LEA type 2 family protein [Pseudomonas sp. BIGb0427]QVM97893.1 LEA type 2 family protein [Pseudomonas sp. SORT22]UVM54794.1 LEA type 2 family protein [Pseudomonas sp. B21-012]UVM65776.1 LEA type 2 family protein [Pseudomonas sp. B21-009]SDQ45381.1 LEA14-like dessication related protein [Pseudomonas sp. UC 17F4]